MSLNFDPVFGTWYTGERIGTGTDGRVYAVTSADGKKGMMKIIRIASARAESFSYNQIDAPEDAAGSILDDIEANIRTVAQADGGRYFIRYDETQRRMSSDGRDEILLIRMEEARSLESMLADFSLTESETIQLGISVCRSLAKSRKFGYIYPNLKPENILVDRSGVVKLGDFGSFSLLEPAKNSVAFKKTQYYMAPEFIRTGKINTTCDTYALGLVLFMLTNRGRLPFIRPYPEEVTVKALDYSKQCRVSGKYLPAPETASEGLFAVISKACSPDVNERYLNPQEMLADLRALAGQTVTQRPASEVYSSGPEYYDEPAAEDYDDYDYDYGQDDYPETKNDGRYDSSFDYLDDPDDSEGGDFVDLREAFPARRRRDVPLREKITIPDRDEKPRAAAADRRRRPVAGPQMIASKKPVVFVKLQEMKKIIILGGIALLLLILMIASFAARGSRNKDRAAASATTDAAAVVTVTGSGETKASGGTAADEETQAQEDEEEETEAGASEGFEENSDLIEEG